MPALNQRFKSSCDYRVPASGRFARGTLLSCDHVGVLPHSNDFSHGLGKRVGLAMQLLNFPLHTVAGQQDPPATVVLMTSWDRGISEFFKQPDAPVPSIQ